MIVAGIVAVIACACCGIIVACYSRKEDALGDKEQTQAELPHKNGIEMTQSSHSEMAGATQIVPGLTPMDSHRRGAAFTFSEADGDEL